MTEKERAGLTVAFVGHKSLPANCGGVEVHAEEVGACLAELGHRVISFTAEPGGRRLALGSYRGVERRRVGRVEGKHLGAMSQAFTATIAAARAKPDVTHYQAIGGAIFIPIARALSDAAVVVTCHGRDDRRRKWSWPVRLLLRLAFHASARLADAVIVVSDELADQYRPLTRGRLYNVANGVAVGDQVPASSLGRPDHPYVLYAGRLVPEKRVEDLIVPSLLWPVKSIWSSPAVRPGPGGISPTCRPARPTTLAFTSSGTAVQAGWTC
jgi:glycosyltransferase involved in cell wall biosynthesis